METLKTSKLTRFLEEFNISNREQLMRELDQASLMLEEVCKDQVVRIG